MNIGEPSLIATVGIHQPDLRPAVWISIATESNLFPIRRPSCAVIVIRIIAVIRQLGELASVSVYSVNMYGWLLIAGDGPHPIGKCEFAAIWRPRKCGRA